MAYIWLLGLILADDRAAEALPCWLTFPIKYSVEENSREVKLISFGCSQTTVGAVVEGDPQNCN